MVAAYAFDEGTGSTVADSAASAGPGTIEGATWTSSGKFGSALQFNGGARVRVPDSNALDLTSAMTLEAWVYPTSSQSLWRTVVQKETDSYLLHASSSAGGLVPATGGTFGGNGNWTAAPSAITVNTWTHLAATYDGSMIRLYVNGLLVSSVTQTGSITPTSSPLTIGGNDPYGEYFVGRIDDVRVYNRALTATDIQTDMTTPVGGPPANGPKLVITAPAAGATVNGGVVNIAYTTAGDLTGVDHVHFQIDQDPVKMDLSLDGSYAFSGVHVGTHTLKGWLVRSDHSTIVGTDATPVQFTNVPDPADPTPPTVSVTAPAPGSVSGALTVTANAADNVGVYGVQFLLDGAPLGAEDLSAPFSVPWDSTTAANGTHALSAVARDSAGQETTSFAVVVTVANAGPNDPSRIGSWSAPTTWPIIPIHASLLPNGKVLAYDSDTSSAANPRLWDPVSNTFTQVPYNDSADLFCSAHTPLPDGRILVAGGHAGGYWGLTNTTIFNPSTSTWTDVQDMTYRRWYPSLVKLPDGRMLAVSGATDCPECASETATHNGIAALPEIFNPVTNTWSILSSASLRLPLYPHLYVLPGRTGVRGGDSGGADPAARCST